MRVTRRAIAKAQERVKCYLRYQQTLGVRSDLHRAASDVCRSARISVNYAQTLDVDFFYLEDGHWAETDGTSLSLNTWKQYTEELLYYTILHETLHGIVLRSGKYELSEQLEHKMMLQLDERLI